MRFSIITITYNAEAYLKETLESVAQQEFTDFEHIVWDGGSVDKTLEIALSYPHVKVKQGKDRGIADAMNKGAHYARGEYLFHLHADDSFAHPKALSFVDCALKHHPKTRCLTGNIEVINEKGERIEESRHRLFNHRKLRRYNTISHPATCIERELFWEVGGFNPDLRYCMDYDLWLKVAQKTMPFLLPTMLACFRQHSHSLSTSEPYLVTDEAYLVRNRYVCSLWERVLSFRTWKKRRSKIKNHF